MNEPDAQIVQLVEAILKKVSIRERNFEIFHCKNMRNCMVTRNEQHAPILLYNDVFLGRVKSSLGFSEGDLIPLSEDNEDYWTILSVMAHEVGHIVQNHFILTDESRPDYEAQADYFMGSVMAKMGASLTQAQSGLKKYVHESKKGGTHPPKEQRLVECQKGWESVQLEHSGKTETSVQKGLEAYSAKDWTNAFQQLSKNTKSANFDGRAAYCLAKLHEEGRGTVKNWDKAVQFYEEAADRDDIDAQAKLGFYYLDQNKYPKAVYWLEKAAQMGDIEAAYQMGILYKLEKGVLQNKEEMLKWYQLAAKNGHKQAQQDLTSWGETW